MTLSEMIAVILALFLFSTAVAVHTEDDLKAKIFIRDIKLSRSEVLKLLKMANLTHHGYEREVSSKTVKRPGSSKSEFKELHFYYKVVNCSRILEIEQELNKLIPGVFKYDVADQLGPEVKTRHLDRMGRCKVGLEIDFTRVDTYQRSNRRGLSSAGRSRGKVTAIEQVNDAGKIDSIRKMAQKGWEKVKETAVVMAIEEGLKTAYETGKEMYNKAKEAITNTSSRRRSSSSSSSSGSSSSSSSSSGGGGFWRR